MSVLSALVPNLGAYAAIAGIATATVGAGYVVHKFDEARYADLVAADAKAQSLAVALAAAQQKNLDAITIKDASKEQAAQSQIAATTAAIKSEIHTYVTRLQDSKTAAPGCVTYGLVRLHDAAALGVDPSTLQLPAGKSDDACAPVAPSALAAGIVANYGAARANAEQLAGLQDDIRAKEPHEPARLP